MELYHRFTTTWKLLGMKGSGRAVFQALHDAYSESHRAYHTTQHLEECLTEFDTARHLIQNPCAVEIALWYHDIIYDPLKGDNELKSAELATKQLSAAGAQQRFTERVFDLIMCTTHDATPQGNDEQLLVDIDLSILGRPSERFGEYCMQVREEYSFVDQTLYNAKRTHVLESFLNRPTLYSTDFFKTRFEAQARKNLKQEINSLTVVIP